MQHPAGLSPRVRGNRHPPSDWAAAHRVYPRVYGGTIREALPAEDPEGLSPRVRGNRNILFPERFRPRSIPACTGEPETSPGPAHSIRVYPRVYGGTVATGRGTRPGVGLSPRVRGNPRRRHTGSRKGGSIPACTGEPLPRLLWQALRRVYPRVYGGTANAGKGLAACKGLSPRVRGNHAPALASMGNAGSIPACTGEPLPSPYQANRGRVYPRVYGGTLADHQAPLLLNGLSPRVRGNHLDQARMPSRLGSIPACTGEPEISLLRENGRRVYPRVYGGTLRKCRTTRSIGGLSPRVRGNLLVLWIVYRGTGSIPACTGEPHPLRHRQREGEVYPRVYGGTINGGADACQSEGLSPRVRGEPMAPGLHQHTIRVYPRVYGGTMNRHPGKPNERGLSPRVRGNPTHLKDSGIEEGSIPACTGEPAMNDCLPGIRRVYPRVYGGTMTKRTARRPTMGLSPRVRGNLYLDADTCIAPRSIPACTGEPSSSVPPSCFVRVYPRVYGGT